MRKYIVGLLGILIFLLVLLTVKTCLHSREKSLENQEVAVLASQILDIQKLFVSKQQTTDAEKSKELDFQISNKIQNVQKTMLKSKSELVQLTVLPRYSELLFHSGRKSEAEQEFEEGLKRVEKLNDWKVKTTLYINFAVCFIHCGMFENSEKCADLAAESAQQNENAKWQCDIQKTLEDLRTFSKTVQSSGKEGEIIPDEELRLDETLSGAGAPVLLENAVETETFSTP